jgi:hypothetical protein
MEEGTPIGESSRQEPRVRVVEVAPSVRNPTLPRERGLLGPAKKSLAQILELVSR